MNKNWVVVAGETKMPSAKSVLVTAVIAVGAVVGANYLYGKFSGQKLF